MGIAERHSALWGYMLEAQMELRKISPNHDLLKLVEVDDTGIHYTDEFGARYEGFTVTHGFHRYLEDLRDSIVRLRK